MKKFHQTNLFIVLSLTLAACGSAPSSQEAQGAIEATETPAPLAAVTETAVTAQVPTATEDLPDNVFQVGDLALVPFAPPWFDSAQTIHVPAPGSNGRLVRNGGLESIVFAENDHLYIYAPLSPAEPPPMRNIFGGVTADTYLNFDLTASFDLQGGYCYPEGEVPSHVEDSYCGNFHPLTCIIFGFIDIDNFQHFCILAISSQIGNAPKFPGYWFRSGFDDGEFFSYTTTDTGSNLQGSDAILEMTLERGAYDKDSDTNELRLRMQDGVLYGYVNGQQLFEQDLEAGTTLTLADGGQFVVFEQLVEGKIGVGCTGGNDPAYVAFSNCDVTVLFGTP